LKKTVSILAIVIAVAISNPGRASVLRGKAAHEAYLYPVVRIETRYGIGSGTVVYSKAIEDKSSTYVLTNYHVIGDSISINEEWDSALKKKVPIERRQIVYVEIFKYRNLSTPVGTMKLEADIIIYNRTEDMALLKLRYDDPLEFVAKLHPTKEIPHYVMDETVAVGCSLGWPALVSVGVITRMDYQIESLPYDMSSAQIVFGNSGGAMFSASGEFIGIPSMVAALGWQAIVPHMGLFIPWSRIASWFELEHYDFIYDPAKKETVCLDERTAEIEAKRAADTVK